MTNHCYLWYIEIRQSEAKVGASTCPPQSHSVDSPASPPVARRDTGLLVWPIYYYCWGYSPCSRSCLHCFRHRHQYSSSCPIYGDTKTILAALAAAGVDDDGAAAAADYGGAGTAHNACSWGACSWATLAGWTDHRDKRFWNKERTELD